MSFVRRLYATVTANLDQAIGQIENHDAVVAAALDDLRDAVAHSRVQLNTVRKQIADHRQALHKTEQERELWIQRARRLGREDKAAALDCLRRRDQAERRGERLHQEIDDSEQLEARMAAQLEQLEDRLSATERQRQALAARDWSARNQAESALDPTSENIGLGKALERWEVKINKAELAGGTADPGDALERRLSQAEQEEALSAELEALLTEAHEEDKS